MRYRERGGGTAQVLMRGDNFPGGAILSTGTCLVPPAPLSLTADDLTTIAIDGLGTLTNPAVRGHVEDTV